MGCLNAVSKLRLLLSKCDKGRDGRKAVLAGQLVVPGQRYQDQYDQLHETLTQKNPCLLWDKPSKSVKTEKSVVHNYVLFIFAHFHFCFFWKAPVWRI